MSELTNVQKTKGLLERPEVQQKLIEMLGDRATGFTTSVLSAMNQNEMLKKAEPNSVYMSALMAASVDLPINVNLGFAYIIPYNVRTQSGYVVKAQFQIGYKGFKQLALRTGQFAAITESDVREGELIDHNRLTGEMKFDWIQDDAERSSKKVVGYVSYFRLVNGFESTFYMSLDKVKAHANKYSQSFKKNQGVWADDFDSMAMKTVCKLNLSKNAPLSIEHLHKAIAADQGVINDVDTLDIDYIDNKPIEEKDPVINRVSVMIDNATTVEQLQQIESELGDIPDEAKEQYQIKFDELAKE